jgi:hypothetical protein
MDGSLRSWRTENKNLGFGGSNSVVESQPSKLLVAGSIPVSRSRDLDSCLWVVLNRQL